MVLGIRSKSRKSVSIQVHYIIHVQEIKPWPPSQSLRSAQSILLQWENGDQNSGSLASAAGTGKIEFNESFRLSVLMSREVSKRGKHRESFLKNCIEFHLYDKTVKSQLLGSATLNLADFGIIKETKALNILLNLKRSFRSSSQPSLYVSIQPFDLECSSSSPSSSLSKELSLDKEESESVSQSLKDDDTEIASFTDDDIDRDDIASNSFQTTRSASQSSRDSIKIIEGGTEESHGKFVLPSESTTSSLHGSRDGEASAQFNGIKSPSSSTVLCSDMENAANGRTSLPKISEESVKLADTSSEIRENTQQSSASSMEPNFERSFLSQVTQEYSMTREDGSRDQIFNNYGRPLLPKISEESVKLADTSSETRENIQQSSASDMEPNFERYFQSQVTQEDSMTQEDGTRDQRFNNNGRPSLPKISEENVKLADTSSEIRENIQQSSASSMEPNFERSFQSQVTQEYSMTQEDGSRDQRFNNNGRPSLPKISEESVKLADTSSEIRENIQQTSTSSMEPNFERSFQSQMTQEDSMTQEDGSRDQRFNNNGRPSLPKISEESVKLADTSSEIRENIQQTYASSMEPNFERSFQSQMTQEDSMVQEDGSRDQRFNNSGRPSLPKISEESVKFADTSSEIRENIQQTSASSMEPNFERSFQSQMTQEDSMAQEDGSRDQRFNNSGRPSLPKISEESVKLADTSSEIRENTQQTSASSMEPNFERSFQSQMTHEDRMTQEDGSRYQRFNDNGRPSLPKISEESVKLADTSSEIRENIQQSSALGMEPNFERYFQSQVTQEDSMTQEDGTRDQRFNKDALEKVSSVSNTGVMEDKEKMEEGRKGQEQFTVRNELLENELVNNFSDDDSTKKGKLNSGTLLLNKKSDEHPTSMLMNNKTEDVTNVKFPIQSAENYGLFISNQTHNQAEEINTMNDVHVGTAYHEDINVNGGFLGNKTELKAEVEMLREELREAAALEVSMYSVIAEHGSSTNKVHAPARRLSRFYFHACRVGSPATIASAAQSAVSGFVLVSKACGNDVPRLTFWFSNIILLRAIVSKGAEKIHFGDGPCMNNECDGTGNTLHEEEKDNTQKHFLSWEDPQTFLVALEKVEAWIFSRIVESVWWQTLTPYMQSAAAKSSNSRKAYEKRYRIGNQDQGSFSIDLWKRAFKDACERLCPLRAGGHECGCLPVIARLVMEQLVSRLDVAMFNAILRESAEEMPMDPISDPISDSKVLPIPAGKSGFGPGAQLKNAIGDWSRWLSDLFSIDDSDSYEVSNESDEPKIESSFKPFQLLNALSDLMMLPLDMLADGSMRKEVCPRFGISLIKQVVNNFVPDEFSPGPIPDAVLEALNDEDIEDDEGSITSFPCSAGSAFYAPPPASSIVGMLQEVRAQTSLRSGSFLLKKLYTSDDELDELDSPLSALGMDDSSFSSKEKFAQVKGGRKVVRYDLLREAWKSTE